MPEAGLLKWLERPARTESFREIREFVLAAAGDAHLPEDKLWKLQLALEEIVVNIIHYGYAPGEAGCVQVGCGAAKPGEFVVEIRDAGVAFDPLSTKAPDLTAALDQRKRGGLGIFLTRKLVDEITYRRSEGINILNLHWRY